MTADDRVRGEPVGPDRVAELVGAAAYGSILLLSGLVLLEATDVGIGHGLEVVLGIGVATWIAHLFAELLAEHARHDRLLRWAEVGTRRRGRQPHPPRHDPAGGGPVPGTHRGDRLRHRPDARDRGGVWPS